MALGNAYGSGGGGGAGGLDYSTTEQDTGLVWHDSEPIYVKTILHATPTDAGISTFAHGITTIKDVVNIELIVESDAGSGVWYPFSFASGSFDMKTEVNGTNVVFTSGASWSGGAGVNLANIAATISYTKV